MAEEQIDAAVSLMGKARILIMGGTNGLTSLRDTPEISAYHALLAATSMACAAASMLLQECEERAKSAIEKKEAA